MSDDSSFNTNNSASGSSSSPSSTSSQSQDSLDERADSDLPSLVLIEPLDPVQKLSPHHYHLFIELSVQCPLGDSKQLTVCMLKHFLGELHLPTSRKRSVLLDRLIATPIGRFAGLLVTSGLPPIPPDSPFALGEWQFPPTPTFPDHFAFDNPPAPPTASTSSAPGTSPAPGTPPPPLDPVGHAKNIPAGTTTPLQFFQLLLPLAGVKEWCLRTNQHAALRTKAGQVFESVAGWTELTPGELYGYFASLLALRRYSGPIKAIWSTNK